MATEQQQQPAARKSTSQFSELVPALSANVIGALAQHGFTHATPVQEAAIPDRKSVV